MHRWIRFLCSPLVLALPTILFVPWCDAMNLRHYDLNSLVYLSTDIAIANLEEDAQKNLVATVTETIYGSIRPGDRLDHLGPFLMFFRPMEGGMRVLLFLDRRPHRYDFLHSDAAKSPFAIPPSGVYLIDPYGHVHEYCQYNNPGPYVAEGYSYMFGRKEPDKQADLALPSLDETKERILAAIDAVAPARSLLDRAATPADVPALMRIVDAASSSEEECPLRMAAAIAEKAMEQIRSLNDPELLLRAYISARLGPNPISAIEFVEEPGKNSSPDYRAARARYLIQVWSDKKAGAALRATALQMLLDLAAFHSRQIKSWTQSLPIEDESLASSAAQIESLARSIFDDSSEDARLRGLCLRFLALEQPEVRADVQRVYARARSGELRFAIERAALDFGDAFYDSLHAPAWPVASRVRVGDECGCAKKDFIGPVFEAEFQERTTFKDAVDSNRPRPVLINQRTRQRFMLSKTKELGGWIGMYDGEDEFAIDSLSGIPSGDYRLADEVTHQGKILSTGYGVKVSVRDTPAGKELLVPESRGN